MEIPSSDGSRGPAAAPSAVAARSFVVTRRPPDTLDDPESSPGGATGFALPYVPAPVVGADSFPHSPATQPLHSRAAMPIFLQYAIDDYASLLATQRQGTNAAYLERVEAMRQQPGIRGKLGRVGIRLGYFAVRSARKDAERERDTAYYYQDMVEEYVHQAGNDYVERIQRRDDAARALEERVEAIMLAEPNKASARRSHNEDVHLAESWLNDRSRLQWRNLGRVALPAASIGLLLGAGAAIISAPWWGVAAAGIGAGYAGRKLGSSMARRVNRLQMTHEPTRLERQRQLAQRLGQMAVQGEYNAAAERKFKADAADLHRLHTLDYARINLAREDWAKRRGAIAAGVGFSVGFVGVHLWQAAKEAGEYGVRQTAGHAAATPKPHATATPTKTPTPPSGPPKPPVPTGPPKPPVPNVPPATPDSVPWEWAKAGLHSRNPLGAVQRTIDYLNHMPKVGNLHNLRLFPVRGHLEVYNGMHALNQAQQHSFNLVMQWLAARGII